MIRLRPIAALSLLLAACATSGCGYKSEGLWREDVRTVAVPIFESREFRRGLEFRLTEAVIKRIEMDTPFKVVPRERADTLLEAEVLQVDNNSFADNPVTELPRLRVTTFTIRFRWRDLRSGRVIVERERFVQTVTWTPPIFETEYTALNEAIDRMAERLVEQMQNPW